MKNKIQVTKFTVSHWTQPKKSHKHLWLCFLHPQKVTMFSVLNSCSFQLFQKCFALNWKCIYNIHPSKNCTGQLKQSRLSSINLIKILHFYLNVPWHVFVDLPLSPSVYLDFVQLNHEFSPLYSLLCAKWTQSYPCLSHSWVMFVPS